VNRQQAEGIQEQPKAPPKVAPSSALLPASANPPSQVKANAGESQSAAPAPQPAAASSGSVLPAAIALTPAPRALPENDLDLPQLDITAANQKIPAWGKVALIAACVLLVVGGTWFLLSRDRAKAPEVAVASSLSGGAGPEWIENFSPDPKYPRTISVLRSSQGLSDYTVEFSASVDVKALGWVFRAKDPANFYVGRIEQEKTLAGPAAVFVYFPVIDGKRQERKRSSIGLPAAPGTVYKIRLDAYGNRFTAWIQDRKVDEWTDDRLMTGGAGLYSESGERALLQGGFRVIPRGVVK
jgi:hypothetical protein